MSVQERVLKINQNVLHYTIETAMREGGSTEEISITGCNGQGSIVEIPEKIEGVKVTVIEKKAFLGNSMIQKLVIPKTVDRVESWAMAQCPNLETVVFLNDGEISFGKGVFDDSGAIRDICLGTEEKGTLSVLLGAVPNRLKAEYLLRDREIGKKEWYAKWDGKLSSFLEEDDEEGYTTLVLCGEEDIMRSVPGFISDKRVQKCGLCLLRLMNRKYLSGDREREFTKYLLRYIKGCESDEAWQALRLNFGDDMAYYRLFANLGGITKENLGAMLLDLGTGHAEAKAYLMKYQREHFAESDFFSGLTL